MHPIVVIRVANNRVGSTAVPLTRHSCDKFEWIEFVGPHFVRSNMVPATAVSLTRHCESRQRRGNPHATAQASGDCFALLAMTF